MSNGYQTTVFIPIGKNMGFGIAARVNIDPVSVPSRLIIEREDGADIVRMDLGPVTKQKITFIQECLEQLKIHAE